MAVEMTREDWKMCIIFFIGIVITELIVMSISIALGVQGNSGMWPALITLIVYFIIFMYLAGSKGKGKRIGSSKSIKAKDVYIPPGYDSFGSQNATSPEQEDVETKED